MHTVLFANSSAPAAPALPVNPALNDRFLRLLEVMHV